MSKDSDEKSQKAWPDYVSPSVDKPASAPARKANGQFNKGFTGNPKGRPRKRERTYLPRQLVADILALTEEIITIKTERGVEKVPAIEVVLKQLRRKAISGHGPSLRKFVDLHSGALEMHMEKHTKYFSMLDNYETERVFQTMGDHEMFEWLNKLRKATRRT